MIWEGSVRFQEIASGNIRAEAGQNLCGEEPSGAISGVHHDF